MGFQMMKKKRRHVDPQQAGAAVLGFYTQIPLPGTFTCTACGVQRFAFGQEDGLCLKCRWTKRAEERQAGSAVDVRSPLLVQTSMAG